ncbi:superoxide dismutase [Candidatus Woesebacteria bacterium RBG_16_34_12]|uniref:Superoxide dismutase n=1 Tax=Candidatus Woesebacteria bacterium RBG_16_34_12 TaxID=1802480 RepID=A0A1F7XA94_9BACT|nr:MAG: superoxide dismutase [Candidatus Woesebacteria bacterium RBG_16_34_12]
MTFKLPKLAYGYNALEPYIDAKTMDIHHTKHHATYIEKLNQVLKDFPKLHKLTIDKLIDNLNKVPIEIKTSVRNNGGGHYNHALFWKILTPKAKGKPQGILLDSISSRFGSYDSFMEKYSNTALSQFGSGWSWLIIRNGKLDIINTSNQDSPIMKGYFPILGIDVWEHAYYLKYQNRRVDYIKAWWNIVNWNQVEKNFEASIKV